MCESAAYVLKDGKEELVLESIDLLESSEGQVALTNMFGEQKTLRAKVTLLSLVNHKILLETR